MLPPLERSIEFDRTRVEVWSVKIPQNENFADRLSAKDSSRDQTTAGQRRAAGGATQRALGEQTKPGLSELPPPPTGEIVTPVWTLERVDTEPETEPVWIGTTTSIDDPAATVPFSSRPDVARLYARASALGRPDELAVGVLLDAVA